MKEIFATFEKYFWQMWNELYKYICKIFETEPSEDFFVPTDEE